MKPSTHTSTPVPNRKLSRLIDVIICQLDEERRPLRRAYLRTLKLLAERHIPVCGKEVRS